MTAMHVSPQGLALIKRFEAFRPAPYRDSVGIPTIGYGATYYPDGRRVTLADPPITEAEASALLAAMVEAFAAGIEQALRVPVTQPQFDALVSWAYNVGLDAARNSTLMRLLNAGELMQAANQLLRWNRAGGKVINGLTRRREAERELFLSGMQP
jgi:lysozyme